MVGSTAEYIEFAPVWGELDDQFNDPDQFVLEDIFDDMVVRQADEYGDTKEPCEKARELLDQWKLDNDGHDYLPDWRAAVARRQPGVSAVEAGGDRQNDAVIRGRETDGLANFLGGEATFLLGEMWGARDRRNTQDGDWNQVTLTWMQWLLGQPGDKNAPESGFTRHPVGKHKAGASIVLGSSVEGARKAAAMDNMYAMGLDIDSGASLEATLEKVEELGLLCFVYTSFRHGLAEIELKRDDVLRKLQITGDPSLEQVQTFLREHDKNRYEDSFVDAVAIREQKQTAGGIKIILDNPPMDKFRLIFPLSHPVNFMTLTNKLGTHQAALDLWEDKVTGLARNLLGVHFDVSCTDPSRLFYTARHPKGADNWRAVIVQGDPLSFEDIPAMEKAAYTRERVPGGSNVRHYTDSGVDLNSWYVDHADRFQIADMLDTLCPDKVRGEATSVAGKVIECPFEAPDIAPKAAAALSQSMRWTRTGSAAPSSAVTIPVRAGRMPNILRKCSRRAGLPKKSCSTPKAASFWKLARN